MNFFRFDMNLKTQYEHCIDLKVHIVHRRPFDCFWFILGSICSYLLTFMNILSTFIKLWNRDTIWTIWTNMDQSELIFTRAHLGLKYIIMIACSFTIGGSRQFWQGPNKSWFFWIANSQSMTCPKLVTNRDTIKPIIFFFLYIFTSTLLGKCNF